MNMHPRLVTINDAKADWSEKHEIGAAQHDIVFRAVEFYLDAVRTIDNSIAISGGSASGSYAYRQQITEVRDMLKGCHSIRIIPDEDQ